MISKEQFRELKEGQIIVVNFSDGPMTLMVTGQVKYGEYVQCINCVCVFDQTIDRHPDRVSPGWTTGLDPYFARLTEVLE